MTNTNIFGRGKASGAIAYLAALFLIVPLVAVVPFSFTAKRFLSMPDGEWSLRHYAAILDWDTWLPSIGNSILIAGIAATLSTILATAFGVGLWFRRPRSGQLWIALVLLPMIVPPVASAVALYFLLAQIGLLDTILGLVLVHTVMVVPFAVIAILAAIARLDRDLDKAARNLGASFFQTIWMVILPNMKFGIASAWFLSFVLSWEEATVTLFVSGVNVVTLPKRIWDNLRLSVDPVIASISVLMILLTFAVILVRIWRDHSARTKH